MKSKMAGWLKAITMGHFDNSGHNVSRQLIDEPHTNSIISLLGIGLNELMTGKELFGESVLEQPDSIKINNMENIVFPNFFRKTLVFRFLSRFYCTGNLSQVFGAGSTAASHQVGTFSNPGFGLITHHLRGDIITGATIRIRSG